jgi:hypothetical protein
MLVSTDFSLLMMRSFAAKASYLLETVENSPTHIGQLNTKDNIIRVDEEQTK